MKYQIACVFLSFSLICRQYQGPQVPVEPDVGGVQSSVLWGAGGQDQGRMLRFVLSENLGPVWPAFYVVFDCHLATLVCFYILK